MPAHLAYSAIFRVVGWHFLPDDDGKIAETISIVPISLSFPFKFILKGVTKHVHRPQIEILSVTEAYLCRSGASYDSQVRGGYMKYRRIINETGATDLMNSYLTALIWA